MINHPQQKTRPPPARSYSAQWVQLFSEGTFSLTYMKMYFHKILIAISYDIVVSERSRQNAGAYYE